MINEVVELSYKNILYFLSTEITPLYFVLLISLGCIASFYDLQKSGNTVSCSFCRRFQNSFTLVTQDVLFAMPLVVGLFTTPAPFLQFLKPTNL